MATFINAMPLSCTVQKPPPSRRFSYPRASLSSSFEAFQRELQHVPIFKDIPKTIKETSVKLLDAIVDLVFEIYDQPLLPSQSNFAPVEEIEEAIRVTTIEGRIPDDFPEGVYIRNGSNPLFGRLKSTKSIFGKTSNVWIEGEGMLHALYFNHERNGRWTTIYNKKYVQTETLQLEKERRRPGFLPASEGDSLAVLLGYLLNLWRFGVGNGYLSNTNVFEHAGKYYSISENHMPHEIDILTLKTLGNWSGNEAWNRPFISHPKKAPDSGELVITGVDAQKPYLELGVISADGKEILHKVDLKLERCTICHDIGVTQRYNIILDFPLTIDITRLVRGGSLMKYDKDGYARIGIMPRYGDADSMKWFEVEPCTVFHIINCFEDGDEVVVMACRAHESIIPGPDLGINKFEWFSRGFKHISLVDGTAKDSQDGSLFTRACEWRLNVLTGEVNERNLTGTDFSIDFPMINENYIGVKNKYGYAQVVDSNESSSSGMAKYGGLAKLYFEERKLEQSLGKKEPEHFTRVEYHMFPEYTFCSGTTFVAKSGALEEDDGWIITFVHNENINVSQVYIIDARKFSSEPVAKLTLPCRVPYGFHGTFVSIASY